MGSVEESTPAKPSKQNASTQESSIMPSYLDWQTALQTYHGAGATPPPFLTSTVASSATPHPYLWGSQHFIPPYGTPFSYAALYPHAGVYTHPNVAMVHCAVPSTIEMGREARDGKDRASFKNSKGSSENALVCSKSIESEKVASGSGNDGFSQSPESGSEGSSDASDENTNQQDEHELKKQRRKLSNRESARRSRLRKQAECEELQANVETLSDRNGTLRKELKGLAEECLKLSSENKLIMEELTHKYGPDVITDLEVVGLDAISTPKVLDSNTQVLQSVKH